jgi:hypothetical protein
MACQDKLWTAGCIIMGDVVHALQDETVRGEWRAGICRTGKADISCMEQSHWGTTLLGEGKEGNREPMSCKRKSTRERDRDQHPSRIWLHAGCIVEPGCKGAKGISMGATDKSKQISVFVCSHRLTMIPKTLSSLRPLSSRQPIGYFTKASLRSHVCFLDRPETRRIPRWDMG